MRKDTQYLRETAVKPQYIYVSILTYMRKNIQIGEKIDKTCYLLLGKRPH